MIENVHFVPLDHPKIRQVYVSEGVKITSDDYSWFDNTIPTVAIKAVLICYNFKMKDTPYHRQRCEQLFQLGQIIRNNIDDLKRNGHPKWKEVNLDEKMASWELDTCSRANLSPIDSDPELPDSELAKELLRILTGG